MLYPDLDRSAKVDVIISQERELCEPWHSEAASWRRHREGCNGKGNGLKPRRQEFESLFSVTLHKVSQYQSGLSFPICVRRRLDETIFKVPLASRLCFSGI